MTAIPSSLMFATPWLRGLFKEIGDRRNHRLRCFFHQPMS
jgi:hypothetical protein